MLWLIPLLQTRKFLKLAVHKSQIRKFVWLIRKSQIRKFLKIDAQLCHKKSEKSSFKLFLLCANFK